MSLSGAQVTQLWPYGGPGTRYGTFSKSGETSKAYERTFTRLGVGGSSARPYGSFSKEENPTKAYAETFTRLGAGGDQARPYNGSFAGKSPGTPFALEISAAVGVTGTLTASGDFQLSFSWEFEPPLEIPQFTGALGVSGDIQVEAIFLNLVPSALGISGALTASGDLQWVQNLSVSQSVAMSGVLSASGDVQVVPGQPVDLETTEIPLVGTLGMTGDIGIGTAFDLAAFQMPIAGGMTIAGNLDNIEIGQPFDIGAATTLLSGVFSITGNINTRTVYTHDSRVRIGHPQQPVKKGRIGKAFAPRRRVGPRRL